MLCRVYQPSRLIRLDMLALGVREKLGLGKGGRLLTAHHLAESHLRRRLLYRVAVLVFVVHHVELVILDRLHVVESGTRNVEAFAMHLDRLHRQVPQRFVRHLE